MRPWCLQSSKSSKGTALNFSDVYNEGERGWMSRCLSFNQNVSRKVILLGNTGVGKTSLSHRLLFGAFDTLSTPTIGAAHGFKEVKVGDKTVKITLWDTAGQEQFRAITPLFIRGAKVAIIVTAANAVDSFHAIPTWLELLESTQDELIPAILCVNKCDLMDPLTDEATAQLIALYTSQFMSVFYASARTGEQIDELFAEAAKVADTMSGVVTTELVILAEKHENKCC
jgi:small GTP-binding protein